MEFMTYVAGFGPKDFIFLLYVPAFLILLVGSAIIRVVKGIPSLHALRYRGTGVDSDRQVTS